MYLASLRSAPRLRLPATFVHLSTGSIIRHIRTRVRPIYTSAVNNEALHYEGTAFGLSTEEAFREFSGELKWYQAARYSNEADFARAIDALL